MKYVMNSSHFDYNPYNKEEYVKALESAGATEIIIENQYGWSNQPEVVCFDGITKDDAETVLNRLKPFDGQWGAIIGDVDWVIKK